MKANNQQLKIKLLNIVLNYIYNRNWVNYDNFADQFVNNILIEFNNRNFDLKRALKKSGNTFFRLNPIAKDKFLSDELSEKIVDAWRKGTPSLLSILTFTDIFPEIAFILDNDVKVEVKKLDVPEDKIQEALRDALREKGASPIPRRGKDTVLEVADLEHFYLEVKGRKFSFSAVVKGYKSLSKLNWESISHQITKAYQTRPDYILLLSAREPVNGVITYMTDYGESVGNKNLLLFMPPMDLAKFLKWRRII
jgi:hypothetical protein